MILYYNANIYTFILGYGRRVEFYKNEIRKAMAAVEHYELSQSIASCVIKICPNGSDGCIRTDADNLPRMRSWAVIGWFADHTCSPGFLV
jgi:hypothetical protein